MFDFSFAELVVIGVVALVVIGPERLPKVARTAGHLLGRVQRSVSDVKSDIQREMQLEELKKLQAEVQQQASDLESSVRGQIADLEAGLGKAAAEVRAVLPDGSPPASPDVAVLAESAPAAVAEEAGPQMELGFDAASGQGAPEHAPQTVAKA